MGPHRTFVSPLLVLVALALFGIARAQEPSPPADAPKQTAPEQVPFLYELQGHGATAYLLGTVHLPDPRVIALPEVVTRAFDEADAVFTEIETTSAAEAEVARASLLDGGRKLSQVLGEEVAARLAARLKKAGFPAILLEGVRPWAAASMLPLLPILPQMQKNPPLDKALFQRAQKAGKAVGGLETVAEQIGVFEGLSEAEQVTLVRETLDQLDRYEAAGRNALEEMIVAWLSGDPAKLLDLLEEGFGANEELSQKLEQRLVWDRNVRLADRLHERVLAKPADVHFFAVGALHLPDGRVPADASDEARARVRGMLTLLRAKGYTVTQRRALAPATVGGG